jgi:hypothetical protein
MDTCLTAVQQLMHVRLTPSRGLADNSRTMPWKEPLARQRTPPAMKTSTRAMPELELALLRRGVHDLTDDCECCGRCHRRPLIGERVYVYESGRVLCELCRPGQRTAPVDSHIVHGPEFGHTMRIIDRRPIAAT